nr:lytic transglycosylase domain-containing protein [Phenylobacterium aquaticum]
MGLAGPGRAQSVPAADDLQEIVLEAASRFALPPHWIAAVMRAESAGQVRAVSPKGALGLMQVMPQTYEGLRVRYGLGADPFQARDNILAGSAYLRELLDRYGQAGMLAAYNAGPARYQDFLRGRRPLPSETQAYVAALAPALGRSAAFEGVPRASSPPRPSLFVALTPTGPVAEGDGSSSAPGLFVASSRPEDQR